MTTRLYGVELGAALIEDRESGGIDERSDRSEPRRLVSEMLALAQEGDLAKRCRANALSADAGAAGLSPARTRTPSFVSSPPDSRCRPIVPIPPLNLCFIYRRHMPNRSTTPITTWHFDLD
jgi:hypothetical protein